MNRSIDIERSKKFNQSLSNHFTNSTLYTSEDQSHKTLNSRTTKLPTIVKKYSCLNSPIKYKDINEQYKQKVKKMKQHNKYKMNNSIEFDPVNFTEHNIKKTERMVNILRQSTESDQKKREKSKKQSNCNKVLSPLPNNEENKSNNSKINSYIREKIIKKVISYRFNVKNILKQMEKNNIRDLVPKLEFVCKYLVGNCTLDLNSFTMLMKGINSDMEDKELTYIFKSLDKDQSGKISAVEVNQLVNILNKSSFPIYSSMFQSLFTLVDSDDSGWVDTHELLSYMKLLGINIDYKMSKMMFDRWGKKINFYNFMAIFNFNSDTVINYEYSNNKWNKLENNHNEIHIKNMDNYIKSRNINIDDKINMNILRKMRKLKAK